MRTELPAKARASSSRLRFKSLPNMDFQLMCTLLTRTSLKAERYFMSSFKLYLIILVNEYICIPAGRQMPWNVFGVRAFFTMQ